MSMTDSIYDVELYANSFLFTPEEFSNTKSRSLLPVRCSHCGETFYKEKHDIQVSIKKEKNLFFCSRKCQHNSQKKLKEERTYTCKVCSKVFTELPSKYASGDFCSKECARKYSSKIANSYDIRILKSNIMCDKLNIPRKTSLDKHPSEKQKIIIPSKEIKQHKEKKCSTKYNYDVLYNKVMKLYNDYNLFEIKTYLSLTERVYRKLQKDYNIKHNDKFVMSTSHGIISFCKCVLNKSHGITHSDVEEVKQIIEHHMYEELLSPHDISIMYNLETYKNGDFINFLKNCLKVNTKSLKEAQKTFHTKNGTYNKLSEKELYYNKCKFRFGFSIPQIQGFELIKKYGIFSNENINGVARDHIVSISYGWENNIPPEMISHPANCQIVLQSDNARKSSGCSITVEELKERIRLWEEGLPLPEVSIIGVGNRTKIHTKALANSLKEHYKN